MDGWMDEWMDGWMDGWVNGWMDGQTDGWINGWNTFTVSQLPLVTCYWSTLSFITWFSNHW